jgi:multicomponent Na+:H+ antiporter subunit D
VRGDGVQALRVGNWPGPFGIVFVLDTFSALMLTFASVTMVATWWFVCSGVFSRQVEGFLLHPMFLMLGVGVNWAFSTGDLFNLFVSFEIMLLATYVLQGYGNERTQVRETFKFAVLNIVASTLFLATAGLTYGVFGSLNMAELALRIQQAGNPPITTVIGTLMLLVFGMKAALFPLFFWLPDAYPKAPRGILAYFAGVLTKVGIYCLYRVFTLLFREESAMVDWFQPLMLAIAGLTMVIGVLGALSQYTFRRLLSFHIISQIGYMLFGLALFTPLALAAGAFFIVHQILVKASLFLVGDAVEVNEGTDELKKVTGLIHTYPGLALLFVLAAFSLAGIPPLSGFYGKYGLVAAGFQQEQWFYVAVSLGTSLFTLSSMVKIWRYSFWGEKPAVVVERPRNNGVIYATGLLVAASVVMAITSAWWMDACLQAGEQLYDRTEYIQAVLGERGVQALELAAIGGKP